MYLCKRYVKKCFIVVKLGLLMSPPSLPYSLYLHDSVCKDLKVVGTSLISWDLHFIRCNRTPEAAMMT